MPSVSWRERLRFLRVFLRALVSRSWVPKRNLAASYALGEGALKDESKARRWYARASAAGDLSADYDLALMLLWGEGGPPEPGRARALLHRAAEAGDPAARRFLAYVAENGLDLFDAERAPAAEAPARGPESASASTLEMDARPIEPG